MKQCLNCKSMIDDDALFCPECGNKVESVKYCVSCGKEIDEDSDFCPYCGASQKSNDVEKTDEYIQEPTPIESKEVEDSEKLSSQSDQKSSFEQNITDDVDEVPPTLTTVNAPRPSGSAHIILVTLCAITIIALGTLGGWYLYSEIHQRNMERDMLTMRFDSISQVNEHNARELSEINHVVNVISEELDSIAIMEDMIRFNTLGNEGRKPTQTEMRERLKSFSEMLSRQKQRIALLEDSLSNLNNKTIQRYRSLVTLLNNQLEEKDRTINSLMTRLNSSNVRITELESSIEELTSANKELSNIAESQREALEIQNSVVNEGFVCMGSKKELQNVGLLSKSSLLTKAKVNTSGFDPSLFEKVDIRLFTELIIPAKSFTILTSMPQSSYSIERAGDTSILRINDPERFWSISRYLIIQTK